MRKLPARGSWTPRKGQEPPEKVFNDFAKQLERGVKARSETFAYVELFSNLRRPHPSLDYQTRMKYDSKKGAADLTADNKSGVARHVER